MLGLFFPKNMQTSKNACYISTEYFKYVRDEAALAAQVASRHTEWKLGIVAGFPHGV